MASCRFCEIVAEDDREVLVYRSPHVAGFLDIRPVFHGHCLFVPRRHVATLADLPSELLAPLFSVVQLATTALERELDAEGTFVAVNNRVSQSVPHLHVHVVPRRRKDGLRGFFWPRNPYPDEQTMATMRRRLRVALSAASDAAAG